MLSARDLPASVDILDELFDGVYIIDPGMNIVFWNQGAEAITGYSRGSIVGRACPDTPLHHEDENGCQLCGKNCPARRSMDAGAPAKAVVYAHCADGTKLPVETHIQPLRDARGQVSGAIEVFRDVSHWKKIEALAEEKNRMVGVLAHDIRSPLTLVQIYGDVIGRQRDGRLADIGKTLQRRSRYMLELVNGILNTQALDQGIISLTWQEADIAEVARECAGSYLEMAKARQIRLNVVAPSPGPRRQTDPVRLEEVIGNLIANALKYSEPKTTVEIRVAEDAGGVRIDVQDQGVGIPAADQEKIFQAYTRANNQPVTGEKSYGLGLYSVKRIVDLFHGRISVTSQPGRGSTFSIMLPGKVPA